MADKMQRPKSHVLQGLDWGKSFYYTHEADAFIESIETERAALWTKNRELLGSHDVKSAVLGTIKDELRDLKSLHADIIDQGRKVQIAASGESKYGAMSDSDFIEWALGRLDGKL